MEKITPIINQYLNIKRKHKDKLLLFRMGDFYELFYDDAKEASVLLDIVLTSRNYINNDIVPMAGFPWHSANNYISKLIKAGKVIAICDQINGIKTSDGLIERKVTKIITPGTIIDDIFLEREKNNFICCIYNNEDFYGVSFIDISSGKLFFMEFVGDYYLVNEIDRINPVEIIVSSSYSKFFLLPLGISIQKWKNYKFSYKHSIDVLRKIFSDNELEKFGILNFKNAVISSGCLFDFINYTQRCKIDSINSMDYCDISSILYLDNVSRRDLEITSSLQTNGLTLLNSIDYTLSPMGKRLLKMWINYPITNRFEISKRNVSVSILKQNQLYMEFEDFFVNIGDIDRILTKISFNREKPIDIKKLSKSLKNAFLIKLKIENLRLNGFFLELKDNIYDFSNLINIIDKYIVDDPSCSLNEGKIINDNCDNELDSYRQSYRNISYYILEFEKNERIRTEILNLKVKSSFNNYYIEVSKNFLNKIPSDYKLISCFKNGSRYINDNLFTLQSKLISCSENITLREKKLYDFVIDNIKNNIVGIQKLSKMISILDVLISFAKKSDIYNWTEPLVDDSSLIKIDKGRHPVLEKSLFGQFHPNDLYMDSNKKIFIITGANMGGKSTYMRQCALIILLAHIGAHVPAEYARIGFIDKIFTRIGTSDDLSNSQSTFFIEMKETSDILKKATNNSFVLIDEIGRGTSIRDGYSLAYSIISYLNIINNSFVLFSTHFHELYLLEHEHSNIFNICFHGEKNDNNVIFSYSLKNSHSDESFGIHVAKMSGMPEIVIENAYKKLNHINSLSLLSNDIYLDFDIFLLKDIFKTIVDIININNFEDCKKDLIIKLDFLKMLCKKDFIDKYSKYLSNF